MSGILREGAWERSLPPAAFEVVNYATGARHLVRPCVSIGVSGFSRAVCNEAGVRQLKALGVDFASGVKFDDTATLDLFLKYGLRAVVGGLPGWWGVLDADNEQVSNHRFGVKANALPVALASKGRPLRGRQEKRLPNVWFYDIPSDGVLFLQEGERKGGPF